MSIRHPFPSPRPDPPRPPRAGRIARVPHRPIGAAASVAIIALLVVVVLLETASVAVADHQYVGEEGLTVCGDTFARGRYCAIQPSDTFANPDGTFRNFARDTVINKYAPDTNYANGDFLRVSPDGNATLIKFDITGELPRNLSVTSATLRLYYSVDGAHYPPASLREQTKSREIRLHNLLVPWEEETVTWNAFHQAGKTLKDQRNVSGLSAREYGGTDQNYREWDMTSAVKSAIEGSGHTLGWTIEDPGRCGITDCTQVFYSSHARTGNSQPLRGCTAELWINPDGVCWPSLLVRFDTNYPIIESANGRVNATVKFNGTIPSAVSGRAPVTISLDANDPRGRLKFAHVTFENETGFRFIDKDLPFSAYNSSKNPATNPGDRKVFWYYGSLEAFAGRPIPEGPYYVNYTIADSDALKSWHNVSRPFLRVNNTPPTLTSLQSSARTINEGARFNLSIEARRANARVDSVVATFKRVADNATFDVRMKPLSINGFGREGTYYLNRSFALPGAFQVAIRANDSLGNPVAIDAGTLRVIDKTAPVIDEPQFIAPDETESDYQQEVGGGLTVRARVVDADPLVTAHVLILDEKRIEVAPRIPLRKGADGLFENVGFVIDLNVSSPKLLYIRIVATDSDGNKATFAKEYPLRLSPPTAPTYANPTPLGWANEKPSVTVTIKDPNLVRSLVDAAVRIGSSEYTPVAVEFSGALARTVATLPNQAFTNGSQVTVRINATDSLGFSSQFFWNFTVDGITPASEMTIGSPQTLTSSAQVVTKSTTFTIGSRDAQSGIERVDIQLANLDKNRESAWIKYPGTFNLTQFVAAPGLPPVYTGTGLYAVRHRAVDRVGNVELDREARLLIDDDAPRVTARFADDELVLNTVEVGEAGIEVFKAYYRFGDSGAFTELDLADRLATPRGGTVVVPVGSVSKATELQVALRVVDKLGNAKWNGTLDFPHRLTAANHAPTLVVDAPTTGTDIKGNVRLAWEARDADGDRLTLRVRVRPIVQTYFNDLVATSTEAKGAYTWDTTRESDGLYEVVISATDLTATAAESYRYVINNTGLRVGTVNAPDTVQFNDAARFEITLLRPTIGAKLKIYEADGDARRLVGEIALADDGRGADKKAGDHIWSAFFNAPAKGRYVAEAVVTYEDAGTVTALVADFEVAESFGAFASRNWVWFVIGAVVLVIIGATVIIQLIRYGYVGG